MSPFCYMEFYAPNTNFKVSSFSLIQFFFFIMTEKIIWFAILILLNPRPKPSIIGKWILDRGLKILIYLHHNFMDECFSFQYKSSA